MFWRTLRGTFADNVMSSRPASLEGLPAQYWKLKTAGADLTSLHPEMADFEACFDYLSDFAQTHSSHPQYPTAGMMIGFNAGKGETTIIAAANVIPPALQEKGVHADRRFEGFSREEGPTVHFEHVLIQAAAHFDPFDQAILLNCDPMCPNCANYVRLLNIDYVFDSRGYERPIWKDKMAENDSHQRQSIPLLRLSGSSVYEFDRKKNELNHSHALSPRQTCQSRSYFLPDARKLENLAQVMADKPAAMLTYRTDKGQTAVHIVEANSEIKKALEAATYNGHGVEEHDPLIKLLVYTAGLGIDPRKCDVYASYPIDVNPALLLSLAGPKSFRSLSSQPMSKGAETILKMSGLMQEGHFPSLPGLNVS